MASFVVWNIKNYVVNYVNLYLICLFFPPHLVPLILTARSVFY